MGRSSGAVATLRRAHGCLRENRSFARGASLELVDGSIALKPRRYQAVRGGLIEGESEQIALRLKAKLPIDAFQLLDGRLQELHAFDDAMGRQQSLSEGHRGAAAFAGILDGGERLAKMVDRHWLLSGELGTAKLEQDTSADLDRRRLAERPPQVTDSRLRSPVRHRLACGAPKNLDHPGVVARIGAQKVHCDSVRGGFFPGEKPRRPRMRGAALTDGKLLVDGGPDERMGEAKGPLGVQDGRGAQRVRGCGGLLMLEPSEVGGLTQLRSGAQCGDRAHQRTGRRPKPFDPRAHFAAYRRDPQVGYSRGVRHDRAEAVGRCSGQELSQVKRISPARGVAHVHELLGRLLPKGRARNLSRRVETQGPRTSHFGNRRLMYCAKHVAGRSRHGRPPGNNDRRANPLDPPRQVRDEPQRRGVGPMHVVNGQQQRATIRQVGAQPVQATQRRGRGIGGRRRRPRVTRVDDRRGVDGRPPEQLRSLLV